MTRVTSGKSRVRENRLPGSVRAEPNGRATRPLPPTTAIPDAGCQKCNDTTWTTCQVETGPILPDADAVKHDLCVGHHRLTPSVQSHDSAVAAFERIVARSSRFHDPPIFWTLLPHDTRGMPRLDDRRVISGIVHVLRSGGRWVDTPSGHGPRKTVQPLRPLGGPKAYGNKRFMRWLRRAGRQPS